ncbi:MAG: HEAT repeat domain-containing protein [Pirellulaceae bacterium]|nr:HEAT repeat domain-containing protein [Pirellulaceae bacterium]
MPRHLRLLCLLVPHALLLVVAVHAEESTPGIVDPPLPDGTLSATQRIAGLKMPAGLSAALFAAEPLLASPVAICLDEQGRLFVAEEYRFNRGTQENRTRPFLLEDDLQSRTVADRLAMHRKFASKFDGGLSWFTRYTDQVRRLTDSDGDGRADLSSVFAAGLNGPLDGLAAGVIAREGDIYLTNIPHLWRLRDGDGDGVAEQREQLLSGFGVNAAFLGHDLHGLAWGPDGKLYFSVGDRGFHVVTKEERTLGLPRRGAVFRCQPDGSEFEVLHVGLRNPQELAFDEYGNLFTADNNCDKGDHSRLVWIVPGGDSGWNMAFQTIPKPYETGPWHAENMWQLTADPHPGPLPAGEGIERPASILPPLGKLGAGPSGFAYNATICLPDQFRGRFFLCNYTGNGGIETFRIQPKGAAFELVDPQDFLKPISATDCEFGYDGKLYVSDFVGLDWNGTSRGGRIYTVFQHQQIESAPAARLAALFRAGFKHRENDELAELLKHADMRVRLRAQWALAERGDRGTGVFLSAIMPGGERLWRLHGLWGLGQIGRRFPDALRHLLPLSADGDEEVRTQAAKTLGEARHAAAADSLLALLNDQSPRVRFHAAIALGQLRHKPAVQGLADLVRENANRDRHLRHAAVFALAEIGDRTAVQRLAVDQDAAVRLAACLVMRRWADPGIARFLKDDDLGIVTEAARAINDLPIDGATGQLAALAADHAAAEFLPEPLARRILNANFRAADRGSLNLVRMATNPRLSVAIRREALAALGDAKAPPQRDRVTGNWRPLPGRDIEPLRQLLREHVSSILAANSRDLAEEALHLVAKLELPAEGALLASYVRDDKLAEPARVAALEALAVISSDDAPKLAAELLRDDRPAVRAAALRVLARLRPDEALPLVTALIVDESATHERAPTIFEQQQAIALLGQGSLAKLPIPSEILARVGTEMTPLALRLDWLEMLTLRTDAPAEAVLKAWRAKLGPNESSEHSRLALIGGDAARGREVFTGNRQAQCSRCHKVDGRGGDAGPDLSTLVSRTINEPSSGISQAGDDPSLLLRAFVLQSLLAPDAHLAAGFASVTLRLADGRIIAGMLKAETAERIDLQTPDGQVLKIATADIDERTQPKSPMPPMGKVLSPRDLRDVVEFLATRR